MATACLARYRARSPRVTPLYRLFDAHFDEVKGQWEERFERRFGFWRSFVDKQVLRYLDWGLYENGFARIRCPDCAEEYLLAFSCKTRELCPSCAAKRLTWHRCPTYQNSVTPCPAPTRRWLRRVRAGALRRRRQRLRGGAFFL